MQPALPPPPPAVMVVPWRPRDCQKGPAPGAVAAVLRRGAGGLCLLRPDGPRDPRGVRPLVPRPPGHPVRGRTQVLGAGSRPPGCGSAGAMSPWQKWGGVPWEVGSRFVGRERLRPPLTTTDSLDAASPFQPTCGHISLWWDRFRPAVRRSGAGELPRIQQPPVWVFVPPLC